MKVFCILLSLIGSISIEAQAPDRLCTERGSARAALRRLSNGDPLPSQSLLTILQALAARYPDDIFIQARYVDAVLSQHNKAEIAALIDKYQKLAMSQPGNSSLQYLYARSLVDTHTLAAVATFEQAIAKFPNDPWPYLGLAIVRASGRYANELQARSNIDNFLRLCPTSLEPELWTLVGRLARTGEGSRNVALLRHNLEQEKDDLHLALWPNLWSLNFKTSPSTSHEQVRQAIRHDVQHLEKHDGSPQKLAIVRKGYELIGDKSEVMRVDRELARTYPHSREACEAAQAERFEGHLPPDASAPAEKRVAFFQNLLTLTDSEIVSCPSVKVWRDRLWSLSELPGSSEQELVAAGSGYINAYHAEGTKLYFPPLEFEVAGVYLKRKVAVTRVPELIRQGQSFYQELQVHSDRSTESDGGAATDLFVQIQAATHLLQAASLSKNPEIAKAAIAELGNTTTTDASLNFELKVLRAKYAELERHKLDALVLYREAQEQATPVNSGEAKDIAEAQQRLWKDLGGSDATLAGWNKPVNEKEKSTDEGWMSVAKPMQPWTLADIEGRTWTLQSLAGRVILINIWATWCVPCQQELAALQHLVGEAKKMPNVQIITFNIDEEVGVVAPFVKAKGYTFPVLLAKDYMDSVHVEPGIPRNWIVDAHGTLRAEHMGFESGSEWEQKILAKLGNAQLKQ